MEIPQLRGRVIETTLSHVHPRLFLLPVLEGIFFYDQISQIYNLHRNLTHSLSGRFSEPQTDLLFMFNSRRPGESDCQLHVRGVRQSDEHRPVWTSEPGAACLLVPRILVERQD
jgi:hypothetical protein